MDNSESWGLIIFAFIALAAVFAFIIVLGGPTEEEEMASGFVAASSKVPVSDFEPRVAEKACSHAHCSDGLPAIPTGRWDSVMELYECVCQTSDPSLIMWRSPWGKAG